MADEIFSTRSRMEFSEITGIAMTAQRRFLDWGALTAKAQYVVAATAIRMLMKEESDVSALERERQQLASRIIRAISPRDASGSFAIRDVRKGRFRDDFILRY